MTESWWWEDFSVGQVFRTGAMRVAVERLQSFGAEFDPQPQHLDPAAAAASMFGELVASGWHTAAITQRLLVTEGLPQLQGGSMGLGVERIAWPVPVRPGDALSLENEIIAVRPSGSRPDRGLVTQRLTTRNQRGETVLVMTLSMLVSRRPVPP